MYKIYLSSCLLITCYLANAQATLVIGYQYNTPQQQMKTGWGHAHGANFAYLFELGKEKKFHLGAQLGFGQFGTNSVEQQYSFRGGAPTITTATLWSQFTNFGAIGRYLPIQGKRITPFAEFQTGYMLAQSRISVANPAIIDDDGCVTHETEDWSLQSDGTIYGAIGAGFQINFGKNVQKSRHSLEIQAKTVFGGEIEYANMKRLYNHPDLTNPNARAATPNERPLLASFLHVGTNEQHQHIVAELYTHPLRMWQLNINYAMRFGKNR